MLHTIKKNEKDFNLLYLEYNDYLLDTLNCHYFNPLIKTLEEGKLHLGTKSLLFQPINNNDPIIKQCYFRKPENTVINFVMKCYKIEELLSFYNKYSSNDTSSKQSHGVLKKKSINANQSLFLNSLQSQNPNNQDIINSQKDKKYKLINFGNHVFNISAKNLPEMIEKVIKEKSNVSYQNNLFMEFNKDKKNEKYISHIADVALYFQENNLNFLNLCELLSSYHMNFKEDKSTTYMFVLSKVKASVNIKRDQLSMETLNQNKSFFFILQGEEYDLNMFIEDSKTISYFMYHSKQDEELISELSKRKISTFITKEEGEKHQNSSQRDKAEDRLHVPILHTTSKNSDKSNLLFNTLEHNKGKNNKENYSDLLSLPYDSPYIKRYKVTRILPESNQIGLLLIDKTNNFEFKPFLNNYKGRSLKKGISKIYAVIKYRYLYKYKALNIFFYDSKRSKLFIFEEESLCNDVYEFIQTNAPNIDTNFEDIKYHTSLWMDGYITNYDYLIYLNHMSCRSFSDMSQYPVMPWVLANYETTEELDLTDEKNYRDLSKPIAALNPNKSNKLKENYLEIKEMIEVPFLYGTHYSNPAHVSYYLIRSCPLFHMRLQNKFDSPDRIFKNITECWSFVMTAGDYKELIPEFYNSDCGFLNNILNLDLGKSQTGEHVNDVVLPKWAKNSRDFINISRAALESDYVSGKINDWIDLIFGYKQRGEEAYKAENLFYHLTYDTCNTDLLSANEIIQIIEWGQTPKQLFLEPHPTRKMKNLIINKVFTRIVTRNPQEDIKEQINTLVNDNEKLEKEIEKLRRTKENDKEELNKIYEDLDRKRKGKIRDLKESLKSKENEFKLIINNLIEQNIHLKENFETYDKNKDSFYQVLIGNLKESHEKDIEAKFSNKYHLYKYIKFLENSLNKCKIKEVNYQQNIEEIKKNIEKLELANKCLREEVYSNQKKIRSLPPEKQLFLYKDDSGKKYEGHILKQFK